MRTEVSQIRGLCPKQRERLEVLFCFETLKFIEGKNIQGSLSQLVRLRKDGGLSSDTINSLIYLSFMIKIIVQLF